MILKSSKIKIINKINKNLIHLKIKIKFNKFQLNKMKNKKLTMNQQIIYPISTLDKKQRKYLEEI